MKQKKWYAMEVKWSGGMPLQTDDKERRHKSILENVNFLKADKKNLLINFAKVLTLVKN
jgi:hypothetical protein